MPVHRRGVGPVGLDGDEAESVLLDQAPRDRRPGAIELARAVAGLAQQHDARVGEAIERTGEGWIVYVRQGLGRGLETARARRCTRRPSRPGLCDDGAFEPVGGEAHDLFQGPRFFEQMPGPRDQFQRLAAGKLGERFAVEVDHPVVG
jgi:hypothetical protein